MRGERTLILTNSPGLLGIARPVAVRRLFDAISGGSPSLLQPRGPAEHKIVGLWWFMFGVSAAVILFVGALILIGIFRRRAGVRDEEPAWSRGMLLGGGLIFPLIALTTLWVLTLNTVGSLSDPGPRDRLTIWVIGRQWWWEVQYRQFGLVTANDIHIPVGQPVELKLLDGDVIHSFWVPQLTGKTDMIPGRTNSMTIEATRPGVYRGQCAEFCGLQHAHMIFYVIADPPPTFQRWLAHERAPEAKPATPLQQAGENAFVTNACVACHTIRGTEANGKVGPDLTHFGSRLSIGAGTVANTPAHLGDWIVDSQRIKPGNIMPPIQVSSSDLQALIAYLEGLR